MLGQTDAKRTEKTSMEGKSAYGEKMKNKFNIQRSKISNHNTHSLQPEKRTVTEK